VQATPASTITSNNVDVSQLVTVEMIQRCVSGLSKGKACGPDELSAEHLIYAHPSLIVALSRLFKLIIHRYVPDGFSLGTIIPLVKDKCCSFNDLDNYRATLIPIVSKVFESLC